MRLLDERLDLILILSSRRLVLTTRGLPRLYLSTHEFPMPISTNCTGSSVQNLPNVRYAQGPNIIHKTPNQNYPIPELETLQKVRTVACNVTQLG